MSALAAEGPSDLPSDGRLRSTGPGRQDARLPTTTVQVHAANLQVLPDGRLGCVWFGGTQEGVRDVRVWFSRLDEATGTWSAATPLSDDPDRSEQNPVLFAAPDGSTWVFWTAQVGGHQDTAEVLARRSEDAGRTWERTRVLLPATTDGGVFVRQPVHVRDDGAWVLPTFSCVRPDTGAWTGDLDTSAVHVSEDQGRTWSRHPVPASRGAVHMNVLRGRDGLVALYRSRAADRVRISRSAEGTAWSAPEPSDLPNNNSSVQGTVLDDGRLALVYNHSSALDATHRRTGLYDEIDATGTGVVHAPDGTAVPVGDGVPDPGAAFWGAPRAPLSLATSSDDGRTWMRHADLATGDGACLSNSSRDGSNHELSYPSVTQTPDGAVHVAYTHHRSAIHHVRLEHTWPGWSDHSEGDAR